MRNWPYAYKLGNSDDSAIKGLFDVAPLPMGDGEGARSVATLGGWNLAVSKYSEDPDAATKLVLYLASAEVQKERAIELSNLPTLGVLGDIGVHILDFVVYGAGSDIDKGILPARNFRKGREQPHR